MKLPMPSGWFRIATSKEVPRGKVLTLKGHVQDVAENSVDFGHFGAVHKYTDLRVPKLGIHFRVVLTATQLEQDTMSFGIGVSSECPPPIVPEAMRALAVACGDPRSDTADPSLDRLGHTPRQGDLGTSRAHGGAGFRSGK